MTGYPPPELDGQPVRGWVSLPTYDLRPWRYMRTSDGLAVEVVNMSTPHDAGERFAIFVLTPAGAERWVINSTSLRDAESFAAQLAGTIDAEHEAANPPAPIHKRWWQR